jgi:hypothetical protein
MTTLDLNLDIWRKFPGYYSGDGGYKDDEDYISLLAE